MPIPYKLLPKIAQDSQSSHWDTLGLSMEPVKIVRFALVKVTFDDPIQESQQKQLNGDEIN